MKIPKIKPTITILLALLLFSCGGNDRDKMFSLLSPSTTGITFKNILQETEEFNVLEYGYLYNGGGVAIGDVNNDGLSDIYFTGNMVGSHLYLNQGDFKFKEVAKEAGVFAEGLWNTGVTMADVNGDGFLDIYICRSAAKDPNKRKNLLFINNGATANSELPSFTEKAEEYGIADDGYSTQAAFFDYDRDGDLDLYILNHSTQDYAGFGQITPSLKNRKNSAYSDKLYRNDHGKYKEASQEAGLVSNVLGFGLGIAVSDINNDGWLDIYISNDYNEQDYLYINDQNGSFIESLEQFIGHTSLFSMGSDIADINNDGFTDIMTLDMLPEGNSRQKMISGPDNYDKYQLLVNSGFYNQTMRNMLQLNNQGESFSEIGQFSGVSNTDWSWASLFADFDNDGFKDLFVTNGYKRDYTNMDFMNYAVNEKLKENQTRQSKALMELIEKIPATVEENYIYRNKGDLSFQKMNGDWGMGQKSLSNGAAYADLDNDGDLDLVVNNIDEEAFIYRNNSELITQNNYLKVQLKGAKGNVFGVGAKVTLKINNEVLTQEMIPTRGYQSSVDYGLLFGLGKAVNINELAITWPDGKVQQLNNIKANETVTLNHTEAEAVDLATISASTKKYFIMLTKDSLMAYTHRENRYVDFKREQLLPHKLSTQGPKITKADINGDGLEDLFIGGAKNSPGQIYTQTTSGTFTLSHQKSFDQDKDSEDIGALFFDADNDGDQDLYVVSGGNEYDAGSPQLQDRIYFNDGKGNFKKKVESIPTMRHSGSCVKAADWDNDGDLDLFVGGRLVPGKYPNTARSYVLENDGKGNFKDITNQVNPLLEYPGMVTDAVWSDFNGDAAYDLILVGEFMGIRAFRSQNGKLEELADNSGLKNSQGWWNKIIAEDFDGDGDIDYVIGNFGLNSQLKASQEKPVSLYVSDFDGNGSLDPILCSYIGNESYPVFSKDDLLGQLNKLKARYVNYVDYADEKITDIFTPDQLKEATVLEARSFETSYMENLGEGRFKLSPLPKEAQFSPIYGMVAKDFDLDGNLDLLLGGNFFGTRVKYGRYDANRGLLLLGDGKGSFKAVNNLESGLYLNGEIRDIAIVTQRDSDQLMVFAQNNGPLQIYRINQPLKK
ncbi:Repeat domain-containing protein [Arenibacter nanhaiticus]|uniref:Repeat domain-containing protein n=1 Tax=Arenibacter nanhaiticus TaxID=558155 RepID=A0A1M6HAM5_9FLAO|nr:VCBS repeat-containing protein [Arenibacter nanhaiticus]SHJ19278.1 Repeat domain-containing protein [Arenibacter nanhaiticus]